MGEYIYNLYDISKYEVANCTQQGWESKYQGHISKFITINIYLYKA